MKPMNSAAALALAALATMPAVAKSTDFTLAAMPSVAPAPSAFSASANVSDELQTAFDVLRADRLGQIYKPAAMAEIEDMSSDKNFNPNNVRVPPTTAPVVTQ